jgi:hypothetical protein
MFLLKSHTLTFFDVFFDVFLSISSIFAIITVSEIWSTYDMNMTTFHDFS